MKLRALVHVLHLCLMNSTCCRTHSIQIAFVHIHVHVRSYTSRKRREDTYSSTKITTVGSGNAPREHPVEAGPVNPTQRNPAFEDQGFWGTITGTVYMVSYSWLPRTFVLRLYLD
jgi:hypothetical protein